MRNEVDRAAATEYVTVPLSYRCTYCLPCNCFIFMACKFCLFFFFPIKYWLELTMTLLQCWRRLVSARLMYKFAFGKETEDSMPKAELYWGHTEFWDTRLNQWASKCHLLTANFKTVWENPMLTWKRFSYIMCVFLGLKKMSVKKKIYMIQRPSRYLVCLTVELTSLRGFFQALRWHRMLEVVKKVWLSLPPLHCGCCLWSVSLIRF